MHKFILAFLLLALGNLVVGVWNIQLGDVRRGLFLIVVAGWLLVVGIVMFLPLLPDKKQSQRITHG